MTPTRNFTEHVDADVGTRLRDARIAAGVSQPKLAFQGCSASYICRVEKGERTPSLQVLGELARRLGTTAEWLGRGRKTRTLGEAEAEVVRLKEALRMAEAVLDGRISYRGPRDTVLTQIRAALEGSPTRLPASGALLPRSEATAPSSSRPPS